MNNLKKRSQKHNTTLTNKQQSMHKMKFQVENERMKNKNKKNGHNNRENEQR